MITPPPSRFSISVLRRSGTAMPQQALNKLP